MSATHKVGDAVEVRRNRNAMGNFFPATVLAVKRLPRGATYEEMQKATNTGGFAPFLIALKSMCLSLFGCCNKSPALFVYTIKHSNYGEEEKDVTQDCIRAPSGGGEKMASV